LVILVSAWLGSMSPFLVVLALIILAGLVVWELGANLKQDWRLAVFSQMIWITLGGAPVIVYAMLAIQSDSQLAAWNAQNLTLTPPAWDLALAFSPAWALALVGIWQVIRKRERAGRLLVVWVGVAAALILAPFGLQRRFLVGFYIPLAGLAAYGLSALEERFGIRWAQLGMKATIALALPSTLLVLISGQFAVIGRNPIFFLEKREVQALEWLEANTPTDALVLASPRMGMFIPAHTGRRVIYGHPFETVNTAEEEAAVNQFFQYAALKPEEAGDFLESRVVDYVLFIPHKHYLGELSEIPDLQLVYDQQDALIFKVISP